MLLISLLMKKSIVLPKQKYRKFVVSNMHSSRRAELEDAFSKMCAQQKIIPQKRENTRLILF